VWAALLSSASLLVSKSICLAVSVSAACRPNGGTECSEAIRDLVETVTVFRDGTRPGGVQVEISGRLTALLGEQAFPNRVKGVWGKMVAEVPSRIVLKLADAAPRQSRISDQAARSMG
jgi:hypothetical protein